MIEAVTFDFWETLAQDSPDNLRRRTDLRIDGLRQALQGLGFHRPREVFEAAHAQAGGRLVEIFRTGVDAGTREQVRIFLACLDQSLPETLDPAIWLALEEAYAAPTLVVPPALCAAADTALWALRDRRVRIGLISNTGRTPGRVLRILLQRAGLLEHFDGLTFSDEAGIRKPDPRIFRWTLNKLGVRPEAAAHVGDNLQTDVAGAKAAGLLGIHVANGTVAPVRDPTGREPSFDPEGPASVAPDAAIHGFDELLAALLPFGLPATR